MTMCKKRKKSEKKNFKNFQKNFFENQSTCIDVPPIKISKFFTQPILRYSQFYYVQFLLAFRPKNFEAAYRPLCDFEDQTKSGFGNTPKGTFKKYHQLKFDLPKVVNTHHHLLMHCHLISQDRRFFRATLIVYQFL